MAEGEDADLVADVVDAICAALGAAGEAGREAEGSSVRAAE
jgi:hypothetical protein